MTIRQTARTNLSAPSTEMMKTKATERAFETFLRSAGRQATKANNEELARTKAFGATIDAWIASLDEDARAGFFRSIEAVATAANARRIATHPDRPNWLDDEADEIESGEVADARETVAEVAVSAE